MSERITQSNTPAMHVKTNHLHPKEFTGVLTSKTQFVRHRSVKHKGTGSIPSQGTYLGYGFGALLGCIMGYRRQTIDVSLSLSSLFLSFPFPSPLSKNKLLIF